MTRQTTWLLTLLLAIATPAVATEKKVWLIDPDQHGPNLPPVGASLFDQLAGVTGEYVVTWPIDTLVQTLTGNDQAPAGALIPVGRSLQRFASRPHFFEAPRVLKVLLHDVAYEAPRLKFPIKIEGRLFIGFNQNAKQLEVISYNDLMGRFEFQIVDNYAPPPAKPRVFYADRKVCLECHQNQAPIFPEFPWNETNFSEHMIRELTAVHKARPGEDVPSYGGVRIAAFDNQMGEIDETTDRANSLQISQTLFQKLCGDGAADAGRCRALIFLATTLKPLGVRRFDFRQPAELGELRELWLERWARVFPDVSVMVPSANLKNALSHQVLNDAINPRVRREPLETIGSTDTYAKVKYLDQLLDDFTASYHRDDLKALAALKNGDFQALKADVRTWIEREPLSFPAGPFRPSAYLALWQRPANDTGPFEKALSPEDMWRRALPARVEAPKADKGARDELKDLMESFSDLEARCGRCHTDGPYPPPFLGGDAKTVYRRLRECAPRMLEVLAWQDEPISPMPPPESPEGRALHSPANEAELELIRRDLKDLVRSLEGEPLPLVDEPLCE